MNLIERLDEMKDPREEWKVDHKLSTIIFVTLCAILCGAESWLDISEYCEAKFEMLKKYVNLDNGVPSQYTFRRLFTLLDPLKIEALLREHASGILNENIQDNIAIDGKVLKGSKRHDLKCLHSVSAFCHEQGLVLAEMGVDIKSNEITAIPLLLDLLEIKGKTITIDALGTQKEIAEKIIEKEGDYVLALKENHPKFYETITKHMQENSIEAQNCLKDYFDASHGRVVRRRYFGCDVSLLNGAENWAGIKSAIAVETISSNNNDPKVTAEWRYYISSRPHTDKDLPDTIRNHWSIENKLHWVLDVTMKEDNDQKSERKSAKSFALLRRIALNIMRVKNINPKKSIRGKFKRAGWDDEFLMSLLK